MIVCQILLNYRWGKMWYIIANSCCSSFSIYPSINSRYFIIIFISFHCLFIRIFRMQLRLEVQLVRKHFFRIFPWSLLSFFWEWKIFVSWSPTSPARLIGGWIMMTYVWLYNFFENKQTTCAQSTISDSSHYYCKVWVQ